MSQAIKQNLKPNLKPNLKSKIIGLTGGIGTGKSTVSALFAQHGIPTVDTDAVARQVVVPNSAGLNAIINAFGQAFLHPDHTLNRAKLRQRIFSDPHAKQQIEAILHPLIQAETQRQVTHLAQSTTPPALILVAIPLLAETLQATATRPGGWQNWLDEIWVVDAQPELQSRRVIARDHSRAEEVAQIMQQQAQRNARLALAHRVITNNGTLAQLEAQIVDLLSAMGS
jgi:dephospho-CoA kinase